MEHPEIIKVKGKWEVDSNRYVGFMDIMGFKDMVARKSHEEIGELLNQMSIMKEALTHVTFSPILTKML